MAVIINSTMGNNGKSLNVGDFLGGALSYWQTDLLHIHTDGVFRDYVAEHQLMRIDGFNEDEDLENEIKLLEEEITERLKRSRKQIEVLKVNINKFVNDR